MPKTDGQTFSLSPPKGRLRDIPKELLSIFFLCKRFTNNWAAKQAFLLYTHECLRRRRCCYSLSDIDERQLSSSPVFISNRTRRKRMFDEKETSVISRVCFSHSIISAVCTMMSSISISLFSLFDNVKYNRKDRRRRHPLPAKILTLVIEQE